jgi:hypothetical protein
MIHDPELRTSMRDAVESAGAVLARLNSSKAPAKTLADDRKLQADVRDALTTLQEATDALVVEQKAVRKHREHRRGRRFLMLLGFGTVVSFVASPWLRNKALDRLFGAEEEFEYSPPPASPTDFGQTSAPSEASAPGYGPASTESAAPGDSAASSEGPAPGDGSAAGGSSAPSESPVSTT